MPLTPEDDQTLAACYRNLQEKPIGPSDPFYVEIWEHSDYDPVHRLQKHIVWSQIQSLQLFSGFSGSAKAPNCSASNAISARKATMSSTPTPTSI